MVANLISAHASTSLLSFLFATLIALPLLTHAACSSPRSLPSAMLSNWKSHMIAAAAAYNCRSLYPDPLSIPVRSPGVVSFRYGLDWSHSAIGADSFLVAWKTSSSKESSWKICQDSRSLDGPSGGGFTYHENGEIESLFTSCDAGNFPFQLKRTILFPQDTPFYFVRYEIQVEKSSPVALVRILDLVTTPDSTEDAGGVPVETISSSEEDFFGILFPSAQFHASLAVGSIPSGSKSVSRVARSVAPLDDASNAPSIQFGSSATLNGVIAGNGRLQVQIGEVFEFEVAPDSTNQFEVFRVLSSSLNDVTKTIRQDVSMGYSYWLLKSASRWLSFFAVSSDAQRSLPAPQRSLFRSALQLLKNGQNPQLGPIVASFHPLYSYKTWSRDGVFAAIILDSAGYHSEADAFLRWASTSELRDDGAFHTCYSVWTGSPVGFVEPQYDGSAAFLLAVLFHALKAPSSNVSSFLQSVRGRVSDFEDFFLNRIGHGGLVPADYSIWEESSDPKSGQPISTQYFTFTQSLARSGLLAASMLESSFFSDTHRSQQLRARSREVGLAVNSLLWIPELGHYARGMWSDTLQLDNRTDGSTVAVVFSGTTRESDDPFGRASSHLSQIVRHLTRLDYGISRYDGDLFFYQSKFNPCGQEVGASSPPWGVTTMFTAFAEMWIEEFHRGMQSTNLISSLVPNRLVWMANHTAIGNMPVGECIDGVTGCPVDASSPDLYEHGGVFVLGVLMYQHRTWNLDPQAWMRI